MDNNNIIESFQKILEKNNKIKNIVLHDANASYSGCEITINNKKTCFRKGKITPTKSGHFVSLWKHLGKSNIPYDLSDNYDLYVFEIEYHEDKLGYFIFPSAVLLKHKILSADDSIGKLGFRLYAPIYKLENKTSINTQKWQSDYFYYANDLKKIKL
jgi:hypothetical protein